MNLKARGEDRTLGEQHKAIVWVQKTSTYIKWTTILSFLELLLYGAEQQNCFCP